MTTHYPVALVFDEFGGQRITRLSNCGHVRAIDSNDKQKSARRIWDAQNCDCDAPERGVTLFAPIG